MRRERLTSGLHEVEQQLGSRSAKPKGTLTVGLRSSVGRKQRVCRRVGRFLARFPEVELVLKHVETLGDHRARAVDLAVMTGWPADTDYVVQPLAVMRNLICASPEYWAREGTPQVHDDLRIIIASWRAVAEHAA
jgi:DNA-binding transcriptional LysR family regulator